MRREVDFAGRQIQGTRPSQEDFFAFSEQPGGGLLAVLADGVGGHVGGNIASQTAACGFSEGFEIAEGSVPNRLRSALNLANDRVGAAVDQNPGLTDMATTIVAVHVQERQLHWLSVGDSLLILFRGGKLQRLNADHSAIGQNPAATHNLILSAISGLRIPMVDAPENAFPLLPGDIVIAASDGILTLTTGEIAAYCSVTRKSSACDIVQTLLRRVGAKERAHQDNTTIVAIKAVES